MIVAYGHFFDSVFAKVNLAEDVVTQVHTEVETQRTESPGMEPLKH